MEVIQHKGDSECRLGAGANDELCTSELLPYDSFMGRFLPLGRHLPDAPNFTRTALGAGLVHGVKLGANPFRFGLIGSTDTHLGAAGLVDERGHPGHGGAGIPIGETLPDALLDPIEYNPGGLAGVWAEENSRDALFEAMCAARRSRPRGRGSPSGCSRAGSRPDYVRRRFPHSAVGDVENARLRSRSSVNSFHTTLPRRREQNTPAAVTNASRTADRSST